MHSALRLLTGSIALGLCACSGSPSAESTSVPRTNLVTGSTGSTWYTIGSAIAEKANLSFAGYPVTAVPGAGGVSNPVRVSMTGAGLGMSYGPFIRAAYRGEAPFRQAYPQLRVIAYLAQNTLNVIARDSLGLESLGDLGRLARPIRVGSGPPGSGELFCLTTLLELSGTDLESWRRQGNVLRLSGTAQRFEDWGDDRLDVAMAFINNPAPQLTELMVSRPGRMLSVPPDLRRKMTERWGFADVTIPSGTYPNQPYDVHTVSLSSVLFAVEGTNDSIVYAVTKALYENQPFFRRILTAFERWDPHSLPTQPGVPFHPGALRYYRDAGIAVDGGSPAVSQ